MGPHPSGLPHPSLALGGGSGLLALSGALGAQLAAKDERAHLEAAAAAAAAADHHRGTGTLDDVCFSKQGCSCVRGWVDGWINSPEMKSSPRRRQNEQRSFA